MRPGENSSGRMVIAIHKKQEGDIISEQSIHITALDKETYDSTAQVLKAAIPYADRTTGKFLAVYARFLEFKKTLDYYAKGIASEDCSDEMMQEMMFNEIAAYEKMGDYETAKEKLREYTEKYPDDENAAKEAEFLETR